MEFFSKSRQNVWCLLRSIAMFISLERVSNNTFYYLHFLSKFKRIKPDFGFRIINVGAHPQLSLQSPSRLRLTKCLLLIFVLKYSKRKFLITLLFFSQIKTRNFLCFNQCRYGLQDKINIRALRVFVNENRAKRQKNPFRRNTFFDKTVSSNCILGSFICTHTRHEVQILIKMQQKKIIPNIKKVEFVYIHIDCGNKKS